LALLVANDNDGPEAHLLTALHGLGDAADLHHAFLPFGVALLIATATATVSATAAITATATATTAFALALALSFSCCWNVSCAWDVLAGSLVSCLSHGCSGSELQARFPGSFGQGLDPTVVQVASAVEDHLLDAFGDGALGDQLTDCG
jgi:hypothetical protein